jgi:hypothetical protein
MIANGDGHKALAYTCRQGVTRPHMSYMSCKQRYQAPCKAQRMHTPIIAKLALPFEMATITPGDNPPHERSYCKNLRVQHACASCSLTAPLPLRMPLLTCVHDPQACQHKQHAHMRTLRKCKSNKRCSSNCLTQQPYLL